jgi:hypothetical protein
MRSLVPLLALPLVAAFTGAPAPAAGRAALHVAVRPAVVNLYGQSTIAVSGLDSRSLEVRLDGATYADGSLLPWRSLNLVRGIWRGNLQTPALRGLYRIELRTAEGASSIDTRLFLRVFAPGTRAYPVFSDPTDAVRWWVRTVPRARLVALKAWPRPAFDRRDLRLHRLFVVAYSPPGYPGVSDRLGMFVTVVRGGYHGGWRLLEATVEP